MEITCRSPVYITRNLSNIVPSEQEINPVDSMNIFILDLDGTLMPSHVADNRCYWQAVGEILGKAGAVPDLEIYENVTDPGILEQWCLSNLHRQPNPDEIQAVRIRFLQLLRESAAREPAAFEPMRGLKMWLDKGIADPDVQLAIATGGWAHTARFKLGAADLSHYRLPLVTSDDASRRTDIMSLALERLLNDSYRKYKAVSDDEINVTYFGDGPWDYQASHALGWQFVGIAHGERARKLRSIGAENVVTDYRDLC
jgi:beta-phosphoglucomutase-like phosphatase (HAD superfamily)